MKKNTEKYLIAGIILAVIAFGIVAWQFGLLSNVQQSSATGAMTCSGGTTILSITSAEVTTSTNLNGKKVLRIEATANGGGECATIKFNPDVINGLLEDAGQDYSTNKSTYYGALDIVSQTDSYSLTKDNNKPIYAVASGDKPEGFWCTIANCKLTYPETFVASSIINFGCKCRYKQLIGQSGIFSSTIESDTKILFNIDGIGSTSVDANTQSATIGTKAFIKWSYNVNSWKRLGQPDYDGAQLVSEQTWRMIDDGAYDLITAQLNTLTANNGYGFTEEKMSIYNAYRESKLTDRTDIFVSNNPVIASLNSKTGNQIIFNIKPYSTSFPVFTIDLDAASVGIHKNTGIPVVKCPTVKDEVESGTAGITTVQVKDSAGTLPAFGLSYICINGGIGSVTPSRVSGVGTTFQDITTTATITTTVKKDFSCTFKAYDLNEPTTSASCVVNYQGVPFTGCTAGQKQCSADVKKLLTCNDAGNGYTEVNCKYGCEAFEDTYRCKLQADEICDDGIDNDGNGLIDLDDPQCKDKCGCWIKMPEVIGGSCILPDLWCQFTNWLTSWLKPLIITLSIVLGLLSGLFATLVSNNILDKFKVKKYKWAYLIPIFLVIGIAVGVLTLFYWWVGLILAILFAIVKIFL